MASDAIAAMDRRTWQALTMGYVDCRAGASMLASGSGCCARSLMS